MPFGRDLQILSRRPAKHLVAELFDKRTSEHIGEELIDQQSERLIDRPRPHSRVGHGHRDVNSRPPKQGYSRKSGDSLGEGRPEWAVTGSAC